MVVSEKYERVNAAKDKKDKKLQRFATSHGGSDGVERPNSGRSGMTAMTGGMTAAMTQMTGGATNLSSKNQMEQQKSMELGMKIAFDKNV